MGEVGVDRGSVLQLRDNPIVSRSFISDVLPPHRHASTRLPSRSHYTGASRANSITPTVQRGHLQLAGMQAWRSARGGAQLLRHSRRNASSAAKVTPRENSIATILARDEPVDNAEVHGWVRSVRKQKKIAFAALGDGSTLEPLQAVLKPEQVEQ